MYITVSVQISSGRSCYLNSLIYVSDVFMRLVLVLPHLVWILVSGVRDIFMIRVQ